MAKPEELLELVDDPEETLGVEHKSWLDLNENKHRADLARHICALANYGGGYVVFGFDDDGTPSSPAPAGFTLNRDVVASITKKYLEPPIACEVRTVTSTAGRDHPVIVVPPHGPTPICSKASGPELNGKLQGIQAGWHYLRKPGPASEQIKSAADWTQIIRRCTLQDRSAILGAVTTALSGSGVGSSKPEGDVLATWAKAAEVTYLAEVAKREFPIDLAKSHLQLSYRVICSDREELPRPQLENTLREVNFAVEASIRTGWSMFHVFTRRPIGPTWRTDQTSGLGDDDFLQANLLLEKDMSGFDFWRVSATGLVTLIREFWEDILPSRRGTAPSFDPMLQVRNIGELVSHAEGFVARFQSPVEVEFRCEWTGLEGRALASFIPARGFYGNPATVNTVVSSGRWPVGAIVAEKPRVISELAARVMRAFGVTSITPDWVAGQMPRWPNM